jgi:hypothetical protein
MPQILTCPCGKKLRVPDGATGVARCPACQAQIPIPAAKPAAPPAAEAPKPPPPKPAPPPPPAPPAKKAFSLDEAVRSADKSTRARPAPPPGRRPKSEDADDRPRRAKPEDEPDDRPTRKPPADDADDDAAPAKTTSPLPLVLGGCVVFLLFGCVGGIAAYYLYPRKTDTTATKQSGDGTNTPAAVGPKELKGHTAQVHALAFTPDGKLLASGSADKTLRVWDVAAAAEQKSLAHPAGAVWGVAWTSEGRVVTASSDGRDGGALSWVDPVTGTFRRVIEVKNNATVRAVAVSPDGRRLAWLNKGTMQVISAKADDPPDPIAEYESGVSGTVQAAFTPDGSAVLLSNNRGASRWVPNGPQHLTTGFDFNAPEVHGVAPAGPGRYAVALGTSGIRIIDAEKLATFKQIADLKAGPLVGVAAAPGGKHVAAGAVDGVRVFDPKALAEVGRYNAPTGVRFRATSVAYSPDGKLIAAGGGAHGSDDPKNYAVYVWDVSALVPVAATD